MIIEGAEPFLLPGGPYGVLLLHGFTGMPPEMALLGEALHRAGHTVLCPRLVGHGTMSEDMEHTFGRRHGAHDRLDAVDLALVEVLQGLTHLPHAGYHAQQILHGAHPPGRTALRGCDAAGGLPVYRPFLRCAASDDGHLFELLLHIIKVIYHCVP